MIVSTACMIKYILAPAVACQGVRRAIPGSCRLEALERGSNQQHVRMLRKQSFVVHLKMGRRTTDWPPSFTRFHRLCTELHDRAQFARCSLNEDDIAFDGGTRYFGFPGLSSRVQRWHLTCYLWCFHHNWNRRRHPTLLRTASDNVGARMGRCSHSSCLDHEY